MNPFIERFLASMLRNFRFQSPKVWAIVVLLVGAFNYTISTVEGQSLFHDPTLLQQLVAVISTVWAILSHANTDGGQRTDYNGQSTGDNGQSTGDSGLDIVDRGEGVSEANKIW